MTAEPRYATGKICYVEIPSSDPDRSAAFYQRVFGWETRRHGDGTLAFDDTVGAVSGMWVEGRQPIGEAGLVVSIMVADARSCCEAIVAAGGKIVRPLNPDDPEIIAWFLDPDGNLFGIYQQSGLAEKERAAQKIS